MSDSKPMVTTYLLLITVGAVLGPRAASAQTEYGGWTWRASVGGVCRCVEDDTVTFQDPTFGTVELDVDGNSLGLGFDFERRFNKLIGLDFAVGYTDMDIDFMHSVGTGVQQDSLASLNIWVAANFHLVNTEKFDFWIGPQIAYVAWLNDLSFNVPGTGTFNLKTDDEFPALGFELGADWWVENNWAVNFAFRFIDADADSDHNLPIDQTFVTVGVAHKF
jgi:outer membrane protein W